MKIQVWLSGNPANPEEYDNVDAFIEADVTRAEDSHIVKWRVETDDGTVAESDNEEELRDLLDEIVPGDPHD